MKMQIKKMPACERPQEKMLFRGAEGLSTSELLALIIRTGSRSKSAIQLAEEIISYSSAEAGQLGCAEVKELTRIEGIGISKACSIVASIELAKRFSEKGADRRRTVSGPGDVSDMLMDSLRYEKKEHLIALMMNAKCEVESRVTISIGELSATSVHPREVFNPAIRRSAAGIIIAHNHPSGDPTPSREDITSTARLREASEIIGIKLLDHIIIGDGKYTSMKAEGLLG